MDIIVTGSPGCGKSHLLSELINQDIPLFSADYCVAKLYEFEAPGWQILRERYGKVFAPDFCRVDKTALRKAFEDEMLRNEIESLIHPLVYKEHQDFWNICHEQNISSVSEIPLYFETTPQNNKHDVFVIGVYCSFDIRYKRLINERKWTHEQIKSVESWHLPEMEKMLKCDIIIPNMSTKEDFRKRVHKVISFLK